MSNPTTSSGVEMPRITVTLCVACDEPVADCKCAGTELANAATGEPLNVSFMPARAHHTNAHACARCGKPLGILRSLVLQDDEVPVCERHEEEQESTART